MAGYNRENPGVLKVLMSWWLHKVFEEKRKDLLGRSLRFNSIKAFITFWSGVSQILWLWKNKIFFF